MNFNIKVPAITDTYENSDQVAGVMESIKNSYGQLITNISAITNLDEPIIYSFIYVESNNPAKKKDHQHLKSKFTKL